MGKFNNFVPYQTNNKLKMTIFDINHIIIASIS